MQYRPLGSTDIRVSAVCQGCWSIIGGATWGDQDREESLAALAAARDAGVNFFDTAPAYGNGESEQLLARAFGKAEDLVIATKVRQEDLGRENLIASCEQSLRDLGRERIDLLQLHWPNPEIPLEETFLAMEQLVGQGKVRAMGVSNFGAGYLDDVLGRWPVVTNQVAYNLLFRAAEYDIAPACGAHGVGLLCYSPLCQGLLAGKFASADDVPEGRARTRHFAGDRPQSRHGEIGAEEETFDALETIRRLCATLGKPMAQVALAWLLGREGVTAVVAGARNPRQARDNAAAGDLVLPDEAADALDGATEFLKRTLGRNADMWQSDSRLER